MTADHDIDGSFSTARVTAREEAVTLSQDSYTAFLYPLDDEKLAPWRGMGVDEFSAIKRSPDFVQALLGDWRSLYEQPFVGITTGGVVRDGVHPLGEARPNDPEPVDAARVLVDLLDAERREALLHDLDAPDWRAWSNPEFVIHRVGLRLEEQDDAVVEAVHALMRASLSTAGYARAREAMELNGYLGELTGLETLMNDRSYWIALYGTPSVDAPWGWQLFGHHLALNVVFVGGRQVIAPVFIGAEPALSDGERAPLFDARERLAIELAESLSAEQRGEAVVYATVLDPAMPEGRVHPADERHLAGAFRDNRVIPYEGIRADRLTSAQRVLLRAIVEDFLLLLPDAQRERALSEVADYLPETHLAWYGATDGSQPFYFRIQSPVILAELDHHAGVWLSNRVPQRFHVHTTLRLPNGNDYGKAYLRQWRAARPA
ncbi:DUF3500 domain-containing protein [Demequina sp. SYSU T00039]|uniref:DUF3500 domain-containing protein n=1 Tax=Demequina lignilytica TaxID=3051663 RepID=A0AAW7MAA7_9MICO|nr:MULTISPECIES: DUF3500 domain-containing protein [unclassified Demequina]MDN4478966.1 DUF3500 domain-containing protein [Demequina sp. SYSU T00039-1]MDN4488841.1 DUF3500 domain-containing protein [Demequina sp. SYSU T00039]MDN4491446.1 DUF3500 domain-containing protein [Demequina sp. SYSU T00068]